MLIWRLTAIISLVIAISIVVFLIIRKYRKNKYYHTYEEDECFKETMDGGARNIVYSTHGETENYIKRYVLRKSAYDKSVICNYNGNYRTISFYVIAYNKKHKVIDVVEVHDQNVVTSSRIVSVPQKTYDVNIVVKAVEGTELNKTVIAPIPITNIRLFSMWIAVFFFTFVYALRHIAIEIAGTNYVRLYLASAWNYIGIGGILLLSIAVYFITALSYRKKNAKNRNGGSTEYEFF